jgi:diketogulonate reductase-like aldo/keto reductase
METRTIKLNNGVSMPQIGLGTFLIPQEDISRTIGRAYELGYRQFDTAWRYHNEGAIAQALKDNGIKREDVFITTKVNVDALYKGGYKFGLHAPFNRKNGISIGQAIQESFDNLQTDYVDLFIIHHPWSMFMDMWRALEKYYKEGCIRAIGVSSFLQPHIEALLEISDVVPAVNQFEISPLNTQKELIAYCQSKGIAVEAMSTFSHYRSIEPRKEIIENPGLKEIGNKYGKSVVQVVLRWLYQQKVILIPKTWDAEHLKENISLFDFELTAEEMAKVDAMDKGKSLNYNPYHAQKGLPKHLRDWDGFKDPRNYSDWFNKQPGWRKKISIY